jgi:hypothetical protein
MAPARTGRDRSRRIAVRKTDQTNNGSWSQEIFRERILITVVIKLIAPKMDDAPAKCSLKIERSTDLPA